MPAKKTTKKVTKAKTKKAAKSTKCGCKTGKAKKPCRMDPVLQSRLDRMANVKKQTRIELAVKDPSIWDDEEDNKAMEAVRCGAIPRKMSKRLRK